MAGNYVELLEYISFFEDESHNCCVWKEAQKQESGAYTIPYPMYNDTLLSFIDCVNKTDLIRQDYLEYLKMHFNEQSSMEDTIESADIDLIKALFTYFIRHERFCEGLWEQAVKHKIFLGLLKRLRCLMQDAEENG